MRRRIINGVALFGFAIVCYAFVLPTPMKKEDMFGTWIGHSDVPNDFYRISLTNSGGLLAYSFTGREPLLYRIEKWELGPKHKLTTAIKPLSTNAYPILVTGTVEPWKVDIIVRGPRENWQHNVTCYRELLMEDRIKLLRTAMDAVAQ